MNIHHFEFSRLQSIPLRLQIKALPVIFQPVGAKKADIFALLNLQLIMPIP